jgi:CRP/FNR family cyclic AMP-dependent transcriptional regulator
MLKLMKTAADGSEAMLSIRGEGDIVGELSAIDARPRLVSAVTITEVRVATIGRDRLVGALEERSELSFALLASLAGQLRSAALHTLALASGDAIALTARRLVHLATDHAFESTRWERAGRLVLDMPISQQELATWAGVSHRSAVSSLGHLRDEKIISTSRLHVEILSLARLRLRAGSCVGVESL